MAASGRPRAYPSLDTRRKRPYSQSPERKSRSWGGGRGALWRPQDIDEREETRSPPSQEGRWSTQRSMDGAWLTPEEEDDEGGNWGAPGGGPREPSWESVSPQREVSRGFWEPPRKRAKSPPTEERWMDAQPPPKGRSWTSPDSQGQPSGPSGHGTRWNRSSASSRKDPAAGYGGSPQSWEDPASETGKEHLLEAGGGRRERRRGRTSQTFPYGERDWGSPGRGRRRELDPTGPARDHRGRQEWKEDLEESGSFGGPKERRREDEGWAEDEGFEKLPGAKEEPWGNAPKPHHEWGSKRAQGGTKGSAKGGFGTPKHPPKPSEGPGASPIFPVGWVPRKEVLDFWKRCQSVIRKSVQEYLLSTCPRPAMPDRSTETPELNTSIMGLLTDKQVRVVSLATRSLYSTQDELLNMLAPAMTIYEMAEEAIEKEEALDPLELREWVRRVLRYIGSINQRLILLRRSQVLGAINPRLRNMTKLVGQNCGGLLFAQNKVNFLKELIHKFPEITREPQKNFENYRAGPGTDFGAHSGNAAAHVRENNSAAW